MTRPPRTPPVPTRADFAAALPMAVVEAACREGAAWNAQLHRPEAVAPRRKADDRPEPTLDIKAE